MLYLPSARRFILPALAVLAVLTLTQLLLTQYGTHQQYGHLSWSQARLLHAAALRRQVTRGVLISSSSVAAGRNHTVSSWGLLGHGRDHSRYADEAGSEQALWAAAYDLPAPPGAAASQEQDRQERRSPSLPRVNSQIQLFLTCAADAVNPHTSHLRLSVELHNISMTPASSESQNPEAQRFFNPAIIPLPYWSSPARSAGPKYVLVSRLVTTGFHQESHICLADVCLPHKEEDEHTSKLNTSNALPLDTRACTPSDLSILGGGGGMRCVAEPVKINIPSTPAERCDTAWLAFPDIPGFHDPRVFWSGKGEPLILVNSASRYGCVGLWVVDLRRVFPELDKVLKPRQRRRGDEDQSGGVGESKGTTTGTMLMSYPHLTEITRNPKSSRSLVEKNWVMWFPNHEEAYVQYDMLGRSSLQERDMAMNGTPPANRTRRAHGNKTMKGKGGRTFAKLTGNGFTTRNLTSPYELPCLTDAHEKDKLGNLGHWHQGSNALRLLLCTRAEARMGQCEEQQAVEDGRSIHFAVVHRKFSNVIHLPLRYERYVLVWESRKPFQIVGVSKFPLLLREEWVKPWSEAENWPGMGNGKGRRGGNWTVNQEGGLAGRLNGKIQHQTHARDRTDGGSKMVHATDFVKRAGYFSYTPSLTWAWKPHSAGLGEDDGDDIDYMSRLGMGYLGDEVLMGVGVDDVSQGFAKVKVEDLLQCLRLCPGVEVADRASPKQTNGPNHEG